MCLCLISSSFQTLGDGPSNCPLFCALFSAIFSKFLSTPLTILPRFSHDFATARRRANNYLLTSNCAIVRRFFYFFTVHFFCIQLSATPRSGISSIADGFHLAKQDFICRKANFVARTVDLAISILRSCQPFTTKVPLTFLPLLQIKYALDHEGWAVGVAVLWGYYLKRVDR